MTLDPGTKVVCAKCGRKGKVPETGEDPRLRVGDQIVCLRCQRREKENHGR